MNCNEARNRLLDLAAPPPAGEPLADHLESCSACAEYTGRLARTVRALGDHHARIEPDAAFAARVVAALPERRGILGWAALKLLPAALALVLVLTGWAAIEGRRHNVTQESGPTDDLLAWILQAEENGS